MKKIFYTLILLFYCSSRVFAQLSTEGKDFWMGFMQNIIEGGNPQMQLFITSKKNTSGQIQIPLGGVAPIPFNVTANQTTLITLPYTPTHTIGSGYSNTGVHIISNDTISVFAINNKTNSTDATVVLPTKALGIKPKYIIASYEGNVGLSEYLIVGMEDNTPIEIINSNGSVESINLNAGQTYQVQSATDLSGTIIEGTDPCKTFAVFAGVVCVQIPTGEPRCDHIYDQMFPIGTWDKEYIITPFGAGRDAANESLGQVGGYILKLFRNDNTTTATINGSTVNWNGSNIVQIAVNDYTPRCITASAPISVVQFMKSQNVNGLTKYITDEAGTPNSLAKGDPSMLVLNPNSQTVSSAIFNTVSTPNLSDHFVNVIIKTADKGTLKLDGVTVANNKFLNLPSCNTYTYAILQITNGSHKLECPNGLIAYCYGVGERESYAYSAGASFDNIKYKFTVQDNYGISTEGDASSCTTTLINFSGIGENVLAWKWDFGDGSPIQTGQNVSHTYTSAGTYQVKMSVTLADGCATRDVEVFRQINIILSPAPNLGNNQQVYCSNSFVTLDAGEFGSNNTYIWSNGATTRTIDVNTVGNYSVKVTNSVGCNATSATIQVSQVAAPIISFTALADSYCINSSAFDLISVVNPTDNPSATTFTVDGIEATSFNPMALGVGTHTVIFNYQDPVTFCSNQASKQVIIYALPTLSFVNLPDFYCINDAAVDLFTKVSPSNTSTGSFKVNGISTNTFNPTTASIGVNYLIEYTYTDPSTTCTNTISKTITIKDLPTVSFTTLAESYCIDAAAINLFDKVSPSSTSTGSFKANQTVLTTAQAQNFSFTNFPTNQNLTIEYIYADPSTLCQNKIQRNVLIKALPTLNFVDLKDVYCPLDAAFNLFDKVNPSDNVQGSFTIDGISAASFNPNTAQAGKNYLIKYTYTAPTTTCTNQIEKSISIPNLPVFVDLDDAYCQDFGLVALLANPSSGTFTINGSIVTALNTALYNAGNIIVSYTDAGNCAVISKEVEIIVPPAALDRINIEDICSQFGTEEPITIDAGEGVAYRWLHSEETSRLVKIISSGTYTVEVLNELNCTETRNITVRERLDCNPRIFMPTAFSPNGDGLNEELEIFGKYFTDFKITIYNRWGEVVFQSKDRYQLWNGTLGGQNAIEGVYTAIVEYRFLNTTKIEKRQSKIVLVR